MSNGREDAKKPTNVPDYAGTVFDPSLVKWVHSTQEFGNFYSRPGKIAAIFGVDGGALLPSIFVVRNLQVDALYLLQTEVEGTS